MTPPADNRLGLTVGLEGGSLPEAVDLARAAVAAGYTDVWTAEVGGSDGFSPLAALAPATREARLGTAIVPVFTRSPALLAMSAATIQNLSGGRFVLGLGTSSDIIVSSWMGASFEKPLTRLRETVEALREILAGKKTTYRGESFSIKDFRLQVDPGADVPIYIAALGPKACRLAGAVADGVIFFLKTAEGVSQALDWVSEGAGDAGRNPDDIDCVLRVGVAMDEDPQVLDFVGRKMITTYAMVDVYNRSLVAQGFEDEARGITEAWRAGERDRAAERVSVEMLSELNISGDAQTCARRIAEFRKAGVKTPVILPISVAGDPDERKERVAATVRSLASTSAQTA